MASPDEEGTGRRRRLPPTDSDLAHVNWTQIGTFVNTVLATLAIILALVALSQRTTGTTVVGVQPNKPPVKAVAPNPNGPIEAKLGDGTGGPPNAGSMWIALSSAVKTGGGKVTFHVRNVGQLPHELVVLKTDKSANGLGTGSTVPEDGNIGETKDVQTGADKVLSLKLRTGHYALICNLPGHYAAGMHADFTVK